MGKQNLSFPCPVRTSPSYIPPHPHRPTLTILTLSAALHYLQGQGRTRLRLAGGARSDTAFSCHSPSRAGSSDCESQQSTLTGPHVFLPPHCALHTVEHSALPLCVWRLRALVLSIAPMIPPLRGFPVSLSHF